LLALKPVETELLATREWKARLDLGFVKKNQRSVLAYRKHYGPLVVQRPFYPEGDNVCHVYLIHPPGGVVGGDKLAINVELQEQSRVLITTPSAGKFYRSGRLKGVQIQQLKVEQQACLEWFPQETIFFNGCNSELITDIDLTSGADFCGWEINCLGRPASSELFEQGRIVQTIKLQREQQPVFIERNVIDGGSELLTSACGFNRKTTFGTMLATSMDEIICDELQSQWHDNNQPVSITLINDILICRYLGDSAEQAKKIFTEVWASVRKKQSNLKPCAPRIWST